MVHVKSVPNNDGAHKSVSTIIAQQIEDHIPYKKGYWMISESGVHYFEEGSMDHSEYSPSDCNDNEHREMALSLVLDSMGITSTNKGDSEHSEMTMSHTLDLISMCNVNQNKQHQGTGVIVNPHGRYVLSFLS